MQSGTDAEVSAELLRFVEHTADFVGVADGWGRVLYLNPAASKRLGVVDPTGLALPDLFAEETAFYFDVIRPELVRTGAWRGEMRVEIPGEGIVAMRVSTTATIGPGGAIDGLVMYASDLPRAEASGSDIAEKVDAATGLLGRSTFEARVRGAVRAQRLGGESCGLVLVDVSDANEVIDTAGQSATAAILSALSGRLQRLARAIDVAVRVDDRSLALLLGAVRSHGEAARIARAVGEALTDRVIPTASGEVSVSVRCGAAVSRPDDEPVDLIERAMAAMSPQPERALVERTADLPRLDEFRVAYGLGEVQPYAQPVVDLRSGRVVGYQGTSRWNHRTLGVLDAADFVDLIAPLPLSSQLDLWVARALAEVVTLSSSDAPLLLYTPASLRLIADVRTEHFLAEIAGALQLSTSQMRLQLARPLLEDWSWSLQDALESLRDAGVACVLTGVDDISDLQAAVERGLREAHLSCRLARAAATDARARVVVSQIVQLAQDEGVAIGATGVDTEPIRDALEEAGCEIGSGDLYGAAEPARDID